jgi:hypothetical protein
VSRRGQWGSGIVAGLVALAGLVWAAGGGAARQEDDAGGAARIRVVHGIADAGPLDVYVDGALALFGISFPSAGAELALAGGDHELAVVPSGAGQDAAIAAGTVDFAPGTLSYLTLVGTTEVASVGRFAVDERPLEAGQGRFRVINGVADAGELVPAFTGGEAISTPIAFGAAAEYAAIDAGTYDLDILDSATGALLLSLPQIPMAEGAATDIILVGQLSDASMQAVVTAANVVVIQPTGRAASIVPGQCGHLDEPAIALGLVLPGQGEAVGIADAPLTAQGYALAPIPFATLLAAPHAVVVAEDEASGGGLLACGAIGGRLTDTGALVIALEAVAGGPAGIAVLAPALEDPATTGVSVFLATGGEASAVVASPVAGDG